MNRINFGAQLPKFGLEPDNGRQIVKRIPKQAF